jgi:transcriptional regulator with PAS, ATPase and Fis domain
VASGRTGFCAANHILLASGVADLHDPRRTDRARLQRGGATFPVRLARGRGHECCRGRAILSSNPSSLAKEAFRLAQHVATLAVDVLLEGETGSGKDMLAREIHTRSGRPGKFVGINCAAIPEHIAESELFGYEAGAFTGAAKAKEGKFETADKGTLYLDEIDSMPQAAQAKLLRALQERGAERLGGSRFYKADFRVIASTKVPLHRLVQEGSFRKDLYFRLNVIKLRLPPLRDTHERVMPLFLAFVRECSERHGRTPPTPMTDDLQQALVQHGWPGNIRELRNAAERHVVGLYPIDNELAELEAQSGFDATSDLAIDAALPLRDRLRTYERRLIQSELQRSGGSVARACKALQVPANTLYYRMKMLGLQADLDPL